ncbi:hypothetical protein C8Q76DRAFT_791210 [Earliella scabrosa]|nr:hypothetical protein C8Q76DRAFT_791210 [Earliella scabrosa]
MNPPFYHIPGLRVAPAATDVHGRWTARTTTRNDDDAGGESIAYHYNIVVCPERPLQIGQTARVLLLSDERYHRLAKKGGKERLWREQGVFGTARRCDAYDQGIEGPVVKMVDLDEGAATFVVENQRSGSPIAYAYITIPLIPYVTVLLEPRTWREDRRNAGTRRVSRGSSSSPLQQTPAPSLDMHLMTTGAVFIADMERWKWVESADSDGEHDGEAGEGHAEDLEEMAEVAAPPKKRRRRGEARTQAGAEAETGAGGREGRIPPPPWW